ncbi:AF4/FMR2 family member lilli isoform X2 [Amyelois transitella]|uniref:AF4/FMR2 family member lilli isoform X2 n=1 Tax=Amyelois transitella TaxID=680683 RepID=UPI0029900CC9|nr:AF4/FMR2 family member lilli isoform X2 [Amyelois transitella]
MHMCYERPGVVASLNGGVGYDKWERDRSSSGSGGTGSTWAGRDRERDRERERLARAHQMSHAQAAEPESSSLFPAPFRVTGNRDHVSQQIQHKLGDYTLAQALIDDPSKSIGIYSEPQSPAPCTRRENEFKKPAHAPTNGRIHHRYLSKGDGHGSAPYRLPPLKIPNGVQNKNTSDTSKPPIESILKEMKSLPTPLSVIAATPRKELENQFVYDHFTNKIQENPQLTCNDLKAPLPKPGIDDRISNSRSSASPDVVNKDLVLSESDDEVGATTTTTSLEPLITPIASASPSSGSSSPSDSESESSSAESTATPQPAAPAPAPQPAQRSSWSLSNFAPPPAQPPEQTYDDKDLRHALADVKGKPSPISDMSDSEASSPSPVAARRRRSTANRASAASSDDETPRTHALTSSRAPAQKRGRPPKQRPTEHSPPKKKRGRPRKSSAPAPPDSDAEADAPPPLAVQDNKTHIFRKVFTPKKGDECGGKGGKGGKGKGGKGKGQVTIIEVTAPESGADDDERRHRERSTERRNEEAIARVSPPHEQEMRRIDRDHRIPDRLERNTERDRVPTERDRIPTERDRLTTDRERVPAERDRLAIERDRLSTDHDRLPTERDRLPAERDRLPTERERIPTERDRLPTDRDRLPTERERLPMERERIPTERIPAERERIPTERERIPTERTSNDRISSERPSDRISTERLMQDRRIPSDRTQTDRIRPPSSLDRHSDRTEDRKKKIRLTDDVERIDVKIENDKLDDKAMDRLSGDKMSERIQTDRYVMAEADVGSGLKLGRGSERLVEASSNVSIRSRLMVRVPLARLRRELLRSLQRPPPAAARAHRQLAASPPRDQAVVAATNHERPGVGSLRYFSYFERLPADALSDEDRDHKYYLDEATRLRQAAVSEQEPLARVMLYLESVLCFVLTGRVLELRELDSKGAFTVYRETIEYIKSIHSMPQRYRASPHSTFNKLDILSLRVQALLYLRMFKMYNREVKEYNKIVQEYQQKPACAEAAASPLSPTPSPGGSVGSLGSLGSAGSLGSLGSAGSAASSGYCSLTHSVPAHAHHALLQLTKYYTFLYVAHDLWEQADCLCRLRANQDLFIAVDRKCGPLSLSSTFRHLVQYVRYAISLLKSAHQ